ncbi:MAG: TIM barrel protein [SAR202 cluster bacterium]|nr:TIM barrel protein [SAR202 cluster bacterium]|tara:strand:- start:52710 stop:53564 length:855 start_codon:yes stop_codon:yes gene_type:complete
MLIAIQGLMPDDLNLLTDNHVKIIRDMGFFGVSCRFQNPFDVKRVDVDNIKNILENGGVAPAQISASYPDIISKNGGEIGVKAMQKMCCVTNWLDAEVLYLRPGSNNLSGSWYPHPENYSSRTFDLLVKRVRRISETADSEGVVLSVEGHVLSPLYSFQRVKDLIDAVGSKSLRFNSDPVNFVSGIKEVFDSTKMIKEMFAVLGDYIVSGHTKDFYIKNELVLNISECEIGSGLLDHRTYLAMFEKYCSNAFMIIEHVENARVAPSLSALIDFADLENINLRRE